MLASLSNWDIDTAGIGKEATTDAYGCQHANPRIIERNRLNSSGEAASDAVEGTGVLRAAGDISENMFASMFDC